MHIAVDYTQYLSYVLNNIHTSCLEISKHLYYLKSVLKDPIYMNYIQHNADCKDIPTTLNQICNHKLCPLMKNNKRTYQTEVSNLNTTQQSLLMNWHALYENKDIPKKLKMVNTEIDNINNYSSHLCKMFPSKSSHNKLRDDHSCTKSFIHEYNPVFRSIINSPTEEWLMSTQISSKQGVLDQVGCTQTEGKNTYRSPDSVNDTANYSISRHVKSINTDKYCAISDINSSTPTTDINKSPTTANESYKIGERDIQGIPVNFKCPQNPQDFSNIRSRTLSSTFSRVSSSDSFCVLNDKDLPSSNEELIDFKSRSQEMCDGESIDICDLINDMTIQGTLPCHNLHGGTDTSHYKKCNNDNNYSQRRDPKKQKYNYREWLLSPS